MQYNQPPVESPITPEQLEALGFTMFPKFQGVTNGNNGGGIRGNPIFIEITIYEKETFLQVTDKKSFSTLLTLGGTFRNINHFISTCKEVGVTFNQ